MPLSAAAAPGSGGTGFEGGLFSSLRRPKAITTRVASSEAKSLFEK